MGGQEGGKKDVKRKERAQRKGRKHESVGPKKIYAIDGSALSRSKNPCPRCGPGTWLGGHQGRAYCGKCGYTVFEKRGPHPAHEKPEPA